MAGPPLRWLLLVVFLAAACPTGRAAGAETVEVPIFSGAFGVDFYLEAARRFEAARPGVRIDLYGDPRIADRVAVRLMEGRPPSATDANLPWARLIASGRVLDLTEALSGPPWEGAGAWRDTFVPGALDRWTVGGRVFGLPFSHAVWALFYDRNRFERLGLQPPRTWEDLFALGPPLRADGAAPLVLPGQVLRYGDAIWRSSLHDLAGPEALAALGTLEPSAWTRPELVASADLLARICRELLVPGWEGMSHTGAQLAFLDGRAAMVVSGSWLPVEMQGRFPDGFRLGVVDLPSWAGTPPDRAAALQTGSGYFFVFADAPRRSEAVEFLRFLTSSERARAFTRAMNSPTAVRAGTEEDYRADLRELAALIARSPGSFDFPPAAVGPLAAVAPELAAARQDLMLGREDGARFSTRMAAAAGAAQARERTPTAVDIRHPWRAAGLGLLAVVVIGWAAFRWSRAPASTAAPAGPPLRAATGWICLGPALLLYGGFVLAPAVAALGWSLLRWDGWSPPTWAGFGHYRRLLFESDLFWGALGNNLFLMVVPALVLVPLALALAWWLHEDGPGARVVRAVLLFPQLLGGIAATLVWLLIYEPGTGLLAGLLEGAADTLARLGIEGAATAVQAWSGIAWLSADRLLVALVPLYIWLLTGFNAVLYLAAMQGINRELHEAAVLDGASGADRFFRVTLPLISETVAVTVVLQVITGLNTFEVVWILTGQDPAAGNHVLGTLLVTTLFREFDVGRAAALAVLLTLLVGVISGLVWLLAARRRAAA